MKAKEIVILSAFIVTLIGAIRQAIELKELKYEHFTVIEALRITDCTYKVGLEDRNGLYFVMEQDLVTFYAMGVNVDDILTLGEL